MKSMFLGKVIAYRPGFLLEVLLDALCLKNFGICMAWIVTGVFDISIFSSIVCVFQLLCIACELSETSQLPLCSSVVKLVHIMSVE